MDTWDLDPGLRVRDVRFEAERLAVDLDDGRTISVPVSWFPRLQHATASQRANWEICGGGFGIHWPEVDEDLSTSGLLRGRPATGRSEPTGTE